MKYRLLCGILLLAASAFSAPFINGDLIANPSPVSFTTVGVGSAQLPGWAVTSGTVDLVNGYWAGPGWATRSSVDLSGNGPGTISQTFDTVIGHLYQVSFYWAPNPDTYGPESTRFAEARIDGAPALSLVSTQLGTRAAMGWTEAAFTFTGSGSNTLAFAGYNFGTSGIAIAHVAVFDLSAANCPTPTPAPEPKTLGMLAVGGLLIYARGMKRRAAGCA